MCTISAPVNEKKKRAKEMYASIMTEISSVAG